MEHRNVGNMDLRYLNTVDRFSLKDFGFRVRTNIHAYYFTVELHLA